MDSSKKIYPEGGEMGKRIREYDWTKSDLGPMETWPNSLLNVLNCILSIPIPLSIYWTPDNVYIYNTSTIPVIGKKHPFALGKTMKEIWTELWHYVSPWVQEIKTTGITKKNDTVVFLERNNYVEEVYLSWSASPIYDETGKIEGVLSMAIETTKNILGERRMTILRKLGNKSFTSKTVEESLRKMKKVLDKGKQDIPFSLLYIFDDTKNQLILKNSSGFNESNQIPSSIPNFINLDDITKSTNNINIENNNNNKNEEKDKIDEINIPQIEFSNLIREYYLKKEHFLIEKLEDKFGKFPGGKYPESSKYGFILPIISQEQGNFARGIIILGINPRKEFDDDYKGFFELLGGQISRCIDTAEAYELKIKKIEMLAELDRAKTIFFSNISHEFRTPLTLMLGPLEDSLRDTQNILSPQQYERQQLIYRNCLRLLKLVNSLLNFSRIQSNRIQAIYEPTKLSSLTIDLASMFRSAIEKGGLNYIIDIPNYEDLVYIDREMYEKIIFNLLSNALKFTLKGSINVKLRKNIESNTMELIIEDTGVGISKNEIPRLFERFYRIEGSKGRSYEGSGIGLALVSDLVKLHRGTIEVESELERGSTFKISFPLEHSHLPIEQLGKRESHEIGKIGNSFIQEALKWIPSSSSSSSSSSFSPSSSIDNNELVSESFLQPIQSSSSYLNTKILVVDDNLDMCNYLKNILSQYWSIDIANNGEEAINYISLNSESLPNLILSDIMMPIMNGFELVKKIRSDPKLKLIPIILLSARSGEESKIEGLQIGADDYLIKPFSTKELLARVQTHLELGKLRFDLEKQVQIRTNQLQLVNLELEEQIKSQKKIEEKLLFSEQKYSHLANLSPIGIFHINENGYCSYINPTFTKICGLTLQDLQDKSCNSFIHPDDQQKFSELFITNTSFNIEVRFKKFNSEEDYIWVLIQIVVDTNNDKIGVLEDLTERKQLEQSKLRILEKEKENERLRAEESEKYQKKQNEFIDTICHEIRNPLNGTIGSLNIIKDEVKKLSSIIFQKQQIEKEVNQKQEKKLEKQIEEKSLISNLNPPLKLISESLEDIFECTSYQTIIINDVLDLSKLNSDQFKLEEIPCDLKELFQSVSRIFTGNLKQKKLYLNLHFPSSSTSNDNESNLITKCDPNQLKQIIVNLISNSIKFTNTGGIDISIDKLNSNKLNQKDEYRIKVMDTGIGLSEADKKSLFEKYWQANSQISYGEKIPGSGLGLTICKKLIELMNGNIEVESEQGKGTCFSFNMFCSSLTQQENEEYLLSKKLQHISSPASNISLSPQSTPSISSSNISLSSQSTPSISSSNVSLSPQSISSNLSNSPIPLKVLIVEDNSVNQKILCNILKKEGFEYTIANNGEEGVQKFLNSKYDIILMDIEMPIMNGYEATKKIRQYEQESSFTPIPIICLSGNSRDEHIEKAISIGINDYLTKPYKGDILLQKILNLTKNPKMK